VNAKVYKSIESLIKKLKERFDALDQVMIRAVDAVIAAKGGHFE